MAEPSGDWKIELIKAVGTYIFIPMGVLVILFGLAGGHKDLLELHGAWPQGGTVATGFFLSVAGYFIGRKKLLGEKSEHEKPNPQDYGIEITYPAPDDSVHKFEVRGKIKKELPDGYVLRILKIYSTNELSPICGAVTINIKTNNWIAYDCNIGGQTKEKLILGVFLVGPDGNALIDYFKKANDKHRTVLENDFHVIYIDSKLQLPHISLRTSDMIECDRVTVKRK